MDLQHFLSRPLSLSCCVQMSPAWRCGLAQRSMRLWVNSHLSIPGVVFNKTYSSLIETSFNLSHQPRQRCAITKMTGTPTDYISGTYRLSLWAKIASSVHIMRKCQNNYQFAQTCFFYIKKNNISRILTNKKDCQSVDQKNIITWSTLLWLHCPPQWKNLKRNPVS